MDLSGELPAPKTIGAAKAAIDAGRQWAKGVAWGPRKASGKKKSQGPSFRGKYAMADDHSDNEHVPSQPKRARRAAAGSESERDTAIQEQFKRARMNRYAGGAPARANAGPSFQTSAMPTQFEASEEQDDSHVYANEDDDETEATSTAGANMEDGSATIEAQERLARIMAAADDEEQDSPCGGALDSSGAPAARSAAAPARPRAVKKVSVPHVLKKLVSRSYISLEALNELNIKTLYGITLTEHDRIDLEHTSCESGSDDSDDQASLARSSAARSEAVRSIARSVADADAAEQELEDASMQSLVPQRRRPIVKPAEPTTAYDTESAHYYSDDPIPGRQKRKRAPRMRQSTLSGGVLSSSSHSSSSVRRRARAASTASTAGRLTKCFVCMYGNGGQGTVHNHHMKTLLQHMYGNVGEVPFEAIALTVHNYYEKVMRPAALEAGQPLPKWRSRDVFVCLMTHNQDPALRLARDLHKWGIIQSALEAQLAYHETTVTLPPPPPLVGETSSDGDAAPVQPVPPPTTRLVIDKDVLRQLRDTNKHIYLLQSARLKQMNFYNAQRGQLGENQQFHRGIQMTSGETQAAARRIARRKQ